MNTILETLIKWKRYTMGISFHTFFHFAKKHYLSFSQMMVLLSIKKGASQGVSCIAKNLRITNPAASQLIDKLVKQGFLMRTENPADRRAKHIELTEKGTSLVKEAISAQENWMLDLINSLTDKEKKETEQVIQRLLTKAIKINPVNIDFTHEHCSKT